MKNKVLSYRVDQKTRTRSNMQDHLKGRFFTKDWPSQLSHAPNKKNRPGWTAPSLIVCGEGGVANAIPVWGRLKQSQKDLATLVFPFRSCLLISIVAVPERKKPSLGRLLP